jgi:hypothetical protein
MLAQANLNLNLIKEEAKVNAIMDVFDRNFPM